MQKFILTTQNFQLFQLDVQADPLKDANLVISSLLDSLLLIK